MFYVLLYITLLYVHFSIAIVLLGKSELVTLLNLSSWCLVMVEWLFLAVPWGCLWFVIVVFPDHTYYFLYREVLTTVPTTEVALTRKSVHGTRMPPPIVFIIVYACICAISLTVGYS